MTREETAEWFASWIDAQVFSPIDPRVEIYSMAIDALRGPRWIKTSEQIPEKSEQAVLALTRENGKWHLRITDGGHVRGWPEECPYWMLPPLPPEK